jgi:hypothetical protein
LKIFPKTGVIYKLNSNCENLRTGVAPSYSSDMVIFTEEMLLLADSYKIILKSIIFWDMTPCSPLSSTDVSEEHIASIFRVEEIGSTNQRASRWQAK